MDQVIALLSMTRSLRLLHQLQAQPQHFGHRLHIGQFGITAIFDITHRVRIRDAGEFGDGIPGEAFRFPRATDLCRDARRRLLPVSAWSRWEFSPHLAMSFRVPLSLFSRRRPYNALELLLSHGMILCCVGYPPVTAVTAPGRRTQ